MSFEQIRDAIMENDLEAVEELIQENPEIVNIENSAKETPLYIASYFGYIDIVELLITNGARIDHQDTRGGWTALSLAASRGHMHVVEYLIIQGANVNLKNNNGDTALIYACHMNKNNDHYLIIMLLLHARADVNIENNDGNNALFYAKASNSYAVMRTITNIESILAETYEFETVSVNKSQIPATAQDLINMDDVNIEIFLAETPQNKIIKVADSFYTLNTKDLKIHYLRQKHINNFMYYPCKRVIPPPAIGVGEKDVHMDKPLFSASYIAGVLTDFVLLEEVQAIVESGNQYFEIIMHGPEVEDIVATASAQMLTRNANAFSANHCQPDKAAKIFKLKQINIVEEEEKGDKPITERLRAKLERTRHIFNSDVSTLEDIRRAFALLTEDERSVSITADFNEATERAREREEFDMQEKGEGEGEGKREGKRRKIRTKRRTQRKKRRTQRRKRTRQVQKLK